MRMIFKPPKGNTYTINATNVNTVTKEAKDMKVKILGKA
jgi:hypothetical protein